MASRFVGTFEELDHVLVVHETADLRGERLRGERFRRSEPSCLPFIFSKIAPDLALEYRASHAYVLKDYFFGGRNDGADRIDDEAGEIGIERGMCELSHIIEALSYDPSWGHPAPVLFVFDEKDPVFPYYYQKSRWWKLD